MGAPLIDATAVPDGGHVSGSPRLPDPFRAIEAARALGRSIAVGDPGPSPLARRAIVNWCRRHARNGDAAVAGGRRTVRPGEPSPLARAQQVDLAETVRGSHPDDHALPGRLWSRQSLGELIHRRYGVRLAPRAVNRQLKAWGLGPRTPAERACALCVAAVVAWLSRDYPDIVRRARARGAQVCWVGRGRLVGLSPAAEVVAAVTTRGGVRFSVIDGRGDAPLPGAFLSRLVAHEERDVHVILDGSFAAGDWPRRVPDGVVLHGMPCCGRATT